MLTIRQGFSAKKQKYFMRPPRGLDEILLKIVPLPRNLTELPMYPDVKKIMAVVS